MAETTIKWAKFYPTTAMIGKIVTIVADEDSPSGAGFSVVDIAAAEGFSKYLGEMTQSEIDALSLGISDAQKYVRNLTTSTYDTWDGTQWI